MNDPQARRAGLGALTAFWVVLIPSSLSAQATPPISWEEWGEAHSAEAAWQDIDWEQSGLSGESASDCQQVRTCHLSLAKRYDFERKACASIEDELVARVVSDVCPIAELRKDDVGAAALVCCVQHGVPLLEWIRKHKQTGPSDRAVTAVEDRERERVVRLAEGRGPVGEVARSLLFKPEQASSFLEPEDARAAAQWFELLWPHDRARTRYWLQARHYDDVFFFTEDVGAAAWVIFEKLEEQDQEGAVRWLADQWWHHGVNYTEWLDADRAISVGTGVGYWERREDRGPFRNVQPTRAELRDRLLTDYEEWMTGVWQEASSKLLDGIWPPVGTSEWQETLGRVLEGHLPVPAVEYAVGGQLGLLPMFYGEYPPAKPLADVAEYAIKNRASWLLGALPDSDVRAALRVHAYGWADWEGSFGTLREERANWISGWNTVASWWDGLLVERWAELPEGVYRKEGELDLPGDCVAVLQAPRAVLELHPILPLDEVVGLARADDPSSDRRCRLAAGRLAVELASRDEAFLEAILSAGPESELVSWGANYLEFSPPDLRPPATTANLPPVWGSADQRASGSWRDAPDLEHASYEARNALLEPTPSTLLMALVFPSTEVRSSALFHLQESPESVVEFGAEELALALGVCLVDPEPLVRDAATLSCLMVEEHFGPTERMVLRAALQQQQLLYGLDSSARSLLRRLSSPQGRQ